MDSTPVDLITVSREYGSGGSALARELGAHLGWPVLDHDLVHRVAVRLRLDEGAVEALDEHPPSLMARISSALLMAPPDFPVPLYTGGVLTPDAVAETTHAAILEAAQAPPLVIVGHGAQCIFRRRVGTLHLRLVAPLEERLRRVCARRKCDPASAAIEAREIDEARAAYVRRYYHADWRDPQLYDLQVNTGRVALPVVTAMIAELVAARRAPAANNAE